MISEEEAALWRRLAAATPAVPHAVEVYADWLLTHDPVRGELVHRRLRSTERSPIGLDELSREERAWATALGLRVTRYLTITLDPFPRQLAIEADRIAELEPILDQLPLLHVTLDFSDASGSIESTFAHRTMGKIRAFSYNALHPEENYQSASRVYFGAGVLEQLCASPNVTQLEVLWVGDESGSDCAARLAAVPFADLRELAIHGEPIGDAGAIAIASSPHLATLRVLGLGSCGIGDAGVLALARSRHLARLESLDVTGNRFGPEGAAALRAMPLRSLRGA